MKWNTVAYLAGARHFSGGVDLYRVSTTLKRVLTFQVADFFLHLSNERENKKWKSRELSTIELRNQHVFI